MGRFDKKAVSEEELECKRCSENYFESEITATKNKKKYCSIECENSRECEQCGEEYNINDSNATDKEKYCSLDCEDEEFVFSILLAETLWMMLMFVLITILI